jgi:valyl-tRNA synthetase
MSKSVGNVIDPIPVIEQYGSDALRMGIIAGRAPAVNRGYDKRKVEDARNFCNKLWNIARYIEDKVGDDHHLRHEPKAETPADHWLLTNLQHITEVVGKDLDNYRFAEAYDQLYHFVWDDFADWYIEASKQASNLSVLAFGLETILKLAHPFAPFVTETIWQTLAWQSDSLLITSSWPKVPAGDKQQSREFEQIKAIVTEVRTLASTLKVQKPVLVYTDSPLIETHKDLIKQLARLRAIEKVEASSGLKLTQTKDDAWLDVDTKVVEHYAKELEGKLKAQGQAIDQLRARLANKSYISNAPADIVDQTREQLKQAETLLTTLTAEHKRFSTL